MTQQALEDSYTDILRKALWSLRLKEEDLCRPTGLTLDEIQAILSGKWSDAGGLAIARTLGLRGDSLAALAGGTWRLADIPALDGLEMFVLPFDDSTVNSYLVWDSVSKEAALFDTGAGMACGPFKSETTHCDPARIVTLTDSIVEEGRTPTGSSQHLSKIVLA